MTPRALRSIRLALGLTVEEFAARIGLPTQDVNEYEHGRRGIDGPTLMTALERLSPEANETISLLPDAPPLPPDRVH